MKINTHEDLYDSISSEIAWRRKELDDIRGLISVNAKFTSKQRVLLRSGVAMAYAHWEGFVKNVGKNYIVFVSRRRFKYKELSKSFFALSIKQKMMSVNSGNIESLIDFLDFIEVGLDDRPDTLSKEEVNTKSNLNSSVLKAIITSLGLDYSSFASKSNLIDIKLVERRNAIAHGQDVLIDESDYIELMDNVLDMMNDFRNQVDNAVVQRKYTKAGLQQSTKPF